MKKCQISRISHLRRESAYKDLCTTSVPKGQWNSHKPGHNVFPQFNEKLKTLKGKWHIKWESTQNAFLGYS